MLATERNHWIIRWILKYNRPTTQQMSNRTPGFYPMAKCPACHRRRKIEHALRSGSREKEREGSRASPWRPRKHRHTCWRSCWSRWFTRLERICFNVGEIHPKYPCIVNHSFFIKYFLLLPFCLPKKDKRPFISWWLILNRPLSCHLFKSYPWLFFRF